MRRRWLSVLVLVAAANLPDMDFIPGYLAGDPRAYHWGPTHSLAAAVLIGGAVGVLGGALCGAYGNAVVLAMAAYGSHIVLDMLLGRSAPGMGLQVFWPFSAEQFMLPWSVFSMAPRAIEGGPIAALLTREIIPVITRELLIMAPVAAASWLFARMRINTFTFRRSYVPASKSSEVAE